MLLDHELLYPEEVECWGGEVEFLFSRQLWPAQSNDWSWLTWCLKEMNLEFWSQDEICGDL